MVPMQAKRSDSGSDDEDDGLNDDAAETRPLNPSGHSASAAGPPMHSPPPSNAPLPASYDFENFDYASMPPPGTQPAKPVHRHR